MVAWLVCVGIAFIDVIRPCPLLRLRPFWSEDESSGNIEAKGLALLADELEGAPVLSNQYLKSRDSAQAQIAIVVLSRGRVGLSGSLFVR